MVSDVCFPRVNGVSTSIGTFRDSLTRQGHRCTVVAPDYGLRGVDTHVQRVPARPVPFDPEDRLMIPRRLRSVLERLDPGDVDVVHLQTPFVAHAVGLRWARRHGLPVLETCHTHFEEYFHHYLPLLPAGWLRAAARTLTRRQCNALDAVIVPSLAMRDVLAGYGVRSPVHVLPTGIDPSAFGHGDGAAFRRRHGLAADRPVLVHVGRIAHEKNLDLLLDVTHLLRRAIPDVVLLVAGDGPALGHCRARVQSLGLEAHVRFVGYLDRGGELQDCYRAGDLFVFASKTETQGLVMLEALALGVPVVAIPALGARDIVEPGRGAVPAPDDASAYAAIVAGLLRDPGRRAYLADEAVRFAREWDSTTVARRLVDVYADVGASRPPARVTRSVAAVRAADERNEPAQGVGSGAGPDH
jgi:glycosyltransferase involved in cell wall biosynthesis